MANAPEPGWRRQQPAKTDRDIFDDDDDDDNDQTPESPAAARALRIRQSKQRSKAPTITNSLRPNPSHALTMLAAADTLLLPTFTARNAQQQQQQQQDIDETPLHPHETQLKCALARIQLRIRQTHHTNRPVGSPRLGRRRGPV